MNKLFSFPAEELEQDTVYVTLAMELFATTLTNDKDRIQFENLVNEAKKKLADSDIDEKDQLIKQLDTVSRHQDELIQFIGGLTVYITPNDFYYYHLAIPVIERVRIGKKPYILPLISNYQYTRDYHLLVLNRESIRLYEGHGARIDELPISEIEDAPVDLETALGTEREGGELNFGTYSSNRGNRGSSQFFHGHGETSEEKDIDRDRYFNLVDKFVYDHYSNQQKLPLIVYTVEENQAAFRALSNNEYLSETGINGSAANLKTSEIEERVAQTIDEIIAFERNALLDRLKETAPENRIENIPDDLTSASIQGRIESLYVEKGSEIPGTITDEGRYDGNNENNTFIEQLVENVIRSRGDVYILDPSEMPSDTPVAARLRY